MSDASFRNALRAFSRTGRRPQPMPVANRPEPESVPDAESSLVDAAVYSGGDRVETPTTLADSYRALRAHEQGVAWIGLYRPDQHDLASVAAEFGLHELAIEDAIVAHQRPKIERYDDTLFVVLRAAQYLDDLEEVEFGELHIFLGRDFVVSVRHSESPDLAAVRRRLESNPDLLALGPEAVLYAILDRVVDGYAPVVAGLANDIDEIETEVFLGAPSVSRRIYELTREVIEFERATRPLAAVVRALTAGFAKYRTHDELQRYLRDVEDHLTVVIEQVDGFRQLLRDILTVNATLVAQKQNEEMKALTEASLDQNEEVKRISAWAAILFAPTLIGTVYGMNFDDMPELHWQLGYPFAVVLMFLVSLGLYGVFRRRGWI
ncbi:magnesium and cobalt transport protein CorA [Nocardioides daejeonensis]|uniref:magnesium and cobalt transport protein CorA n=1 Tax=Nocardioides daejeonensis TaxID=1046556 RepID=UPI000D74CBC7|nr:magnesium and cobalt transport protein CorA [Nocardioides daejeonensis]